MKSLFHNPASYLVAGGFGRLGRCVVNWMVRRGARNLIILSRSGTNNDEKRDILRKLDSKGVSVVAPVCDVGNLISLEAALQECLHMPAIKGCIQTTAFLNVSERKDGIQKRFNMI